MCQDCRARGKVGDAPGQQVYSVHFFQEMQNSTSASSGGSVVRELKRKDQTLVIMDLPITDIQARNCHNAKRAVLSNLYVHMECKDPTLMTP